jgi:lipoate-protein ligase A
VTHALLRGVSSGARRETLRLYEPDDVVVFSLLDARRPGFRAACAVAAELGCGAVIRLAGGHAALFHRGCLAFSWAVPDASERDGIERRFEAVSRWLAASLRTLGVDARVGEVPGEYCPGAHSVNARGRVKLMGVGQRVVRGAAHVGGVVVVRDGARVREVLEPVYRALELPWDPATAGAVEDEAGALAVEDVRRAVLAELAARRPWQSEEIDEATLAAAEALLPWHDPAGSPRGAPASALAATKLVIASDDASG